MRTDDLGHLDTNRLLIFGGAYGNLEATQALFDEADRLNIGSQHIICTGDIPAYCADPEATATLIKQRGVHAIQGNVEQSIAEAADDCGCGFDEGTSCDLLSKQWFTYCSKNTSQTTRKWYSDLPTNLRFTFAKKSFLVTHGGVENINQFIFKSSPEDTFATEFETAKTDAIIAGHCGLPFTKSISNHLWHNAGVIGMPANDGTPRVWYSLITVTKNGIDFAHKPLTYNAEKAQQKMRAANLPDPYAAALTSGLWPSLDILPPAEQSQTGQPLKKHNINWEPSS